MQPDYDPLPVIGGNISRNETRRSHMSLNTEGHVQSMYRRESPHDLKYEPATTYQQHAYGSYTAAVRKEGKVNYKNRIKHTMAIVDPNTGVDVTQEILGTADTHNQDVLTEEVKLSNDMSASPHDLKYEQATTYQQHGYGSYPAAVRKESKVNHQNRKKHTMAIVDPNTGIDVTQEILRTVDTHNHDVSTEEVKLSNDMHAKESNDVAAQFAALVAEKIYHSREDDTKQESKMNHQNRKRHTMAIVDPKTGLDITQEILGTADMHNYDISTEEVKLSNDMHDKESNDIAAQFAALVAEKLYHSREDDSKQVKKTSEPPGPDKQETPGNNQSDFGTLPKEILNLDSRSIELYNKALQEGEDKTHHIRLMLVGHYGVGKTTLKKRLFDENVDITERKSTDGIDVHVGRCKVSLNDGKWLTSDSQRDEKRNTPSHRLARLMHRTGENEIEVPAVIENEALTSDVRTKTRDMGETPEPNESVIDTVTDEFIFALNITDETFGRDDTVDEESDDYIRKKVHLEKLIKEVQHESSFKDEMHCDLSLWDFAGQNIFYATHQAFLSRRAIYLLVIDLSRHIDDTVENDLWHFDCQGEQHCKIAEFIEFWLNSIHEFCSCDGESGPPVILVGTFADTMKQRSDADRCFYDVRSSLVTKVTNCHLTEKQFDVDNTTNGDRNIEALRKYIVQVASEQNYWGERIPAKWITLEDRLMRLKDEQNVKVICKDKLLEENKSLPVPIEKEEEMELFLKFHHETGTILYFGDDELKDEILLDPQWLIDAFKSLITAAMFSITKADIQKKWHEFDRSAILNQDLIELIWTRQENREYMANKELILKFMEKLGFVAKPKQCTDESTKLEDYYLVPCMLKDPPPAKVITWNETQQFKSTSKLCLSNAEEAEQRFIPPTVFNKILAAGINQWHLSKQNDKYMIFCGGAVFQLENNHFLYIFLYEHVIQIWISRLSMEGQNPTISLCRKTLSQIRKILAENVRMYRMMLSFVKCPKASLYSNENMVALQEAGCIRDREISCFCQDEKHVVSYVNVSKYWVPEDAIPKFYSALHLDLERKPTEKDFSRISRRIGKKFKALAYELGLSKPEIDHICMDNSTTADKITAILRNWSKRMLEKATFGELIKGFQEVGIDTGSVFEANM